MIKNNLDKNERNLYFVFFALLIFFLLNIFNSNYSSFATEGSSNDYYVLSQNDVLEIMLWGYPELTRTAVVQPDGMISLPLGGQIDAAGKTLEELRAGIVQELISGKVDVLKAISVASGLTDKAGLKNAMIIRENQEITPVDLEKLLNQNDLSQNYELNSGDSLYIPKAFTITNISIGGEVKSPGLYSLEGKVDVLKAISACGGLTQKANLKNVIINKHNNEVIQVDLEKLFIQNDLTQNYPLETGDSLFVPLTLENNIYVLGEVVRPGIYPIEGDCTVIEAISQAGGYTADARLKSCVVIRKFPHDEEGLKIRTITLKDVKVIREKYEQVIEINLEKIFKDGELAQNIALQPQDIVFIPIRPLSEFDIATILDVVTTGLTVYNVLLK
ncbi:hypothetical protein B6228_04595 [Candidatus Atribacteria bacterium 4572_76]|nr:MAG: hypothetical protein B6228_04595 [Candidatus Atribacteria bacterium 4572_76]